MLLWSIYMPYKRVKLLKMSPDNNSIVYVILHYQHDEVFTVLKLPYEC